MDIDIIILKYIQNVYLKSIAFCFSENSVVKNNSQHENIARKKGGLFSTISTIKSKLVSRKR